MNGHAPNIIANLACIGHAAARARTAPTLLHAIRIVEDDMRLPAARRLPRQPGEPTPDGRRPATPSPGGTPAGGPQTPPGAARPPTAAPGGLHQDQP